MIERKIGEEFRYHGVLIRCVEDPGPNRCNEKCIYRIKGKECWRIRDLIGLCSSEERSDRKTVCFIKVEGKKKKTVWHEPSEVPEQCKMIVFDQDTGPAVGQFVTVNSGEWAVVLISGTGFDHLVSIKPCKWAYLDDLKKC